MYKLVKVADNKFYVVELATNKIIFEETKYEKARKLYRDLKNGVGWCGWTPDMIIRRTYEE